VKCLHGTLFADDESLKAVVKTWFEEPDIEFFFSRNKQLSRKVEKCTDAAGDYI